MQQDEEFIKRISKNIERNIERKNKSNVTNGERLSMQNKENGTKQIESVSLQKLESEGSKQIQQEDSNQQSTLLREVISQSNNSIDCTINDLRSYMKGMFANEPDPSIQKLDLFRVETSVGCAKMINELMKTKLEAIKIAMVMRDE